MPKRKGSRARARKRADRAVSGERAGVNRRRKSEQARAKMLAYWDLVRRIQAAETASGNPITQTEARRIVKDERATRRVGSGVYSRAAQSGESSYLATVTFQTDPVTGKLTGRVRDNATGQWTTREKVKAREAYHKRQAYIRAVQKDRGISRKEAIEVLREYRTTKDGKLLPYAAGFRAYVYTTYAKP